MCCFFVIYGVIYAICDIKRLKIGKELVSINAWIKFKKSCLIYLILFHFFFTLLSSVFKDTLKTKIKLVILSIDELLSDLTWIRLDKKWNMEYKVVACWYINPISTGGGVDWIPPRSQFFAHKSKNIGFPISDIRYPIFSDF